MQDDKGTALNSLDPISVTAAALGHSTGLSLKALSSYRAKRLSLKKRPTQAARSILPPEGKAGRTHVSENKSLHGFGGAFTAPRQACHEGMPPQLKPPLNGTSQVSSTGDLGQRLSILSSKHAQPHTAAEMIEAVRSTAGMPGAICGSTGPTAELSEQPLGIPSRKQAEPEAPARPGAPVSTPAGTCGANGSSAEPAARPSGLLLGSRQPLQGWVPRKRNLASFDALDDLPDLSSLGQQRAAQKPHTSMPFKAPMRPPSPQKSLQISSTTDGLLAMPAALTKQAPALEGSASLSTGVAAANEAPQPASSAAPSRRLKSRHPFAAPRPLLRPEHRAPADAAGQGVSSAPTLCPPGRPSGSGETSAAPYAPANPAGSGLFPGSLSGGPDARTSKRSAPEAQAACSAGGLTAAEPGPACLPALEHAPPAGSDADLSLMHGPCSSRPLQTLQKAHSSSSSSGASEQPQQRGSAAGAADCQAGSRARLDAARSSAMEGTTPLCAPGASRAAGCSGRLQSGRKRLKRLCSDAGADSTCPDGSPPAWQGEDADLLADMGVLPMPRPSRQEGASKASVAQQAPAPVPGRSADSASQPVSVSEDDSWSDDLAAPDEAEAHEASAAPAGNAANGRERSLKRLRRFSKASPEAGAAAADSGEPDRCADVSQARLPKQVGNPKSAARHPLKANPFISSRAALPQEPKLSCHAASAQPQSNMQSHSLSCGDMQELLKETSLQPQVRRRPEAHREPDVAAADVIDLAAEESGDMSPCAEPPAGPQKRLIRLPALPSSSQHRDPPQRRAYLGAYSSADVLAQHPQLSTAAAVQLQPWHASGSTHSDQVAPQDWPEQAGSRWHEDTGAAAQSEQLSALRSVHAQHLGKAQGAEHAGAAAQVAGPSGQMGQPRNGLPWWHRLSDFVPVAALRHGRDPRDGSLVHIDYGAQFSGDKHPAAAGGGYKQTRKRGRAEAEGSGEGHSIVHRTARAKTGRRGKAHAGRNKPTGSGAGGWRRFSRKHN